MDAAFELQKTGAVEQHPTWLDLWFSGFTTNGRRLQPRISLLVSAAVATTVATTVVIFLLFQCAVYLKNQNRLKISLRRLSNHPNNCRGNNGGTGAVPRSGRDQERYPPPDGQRDGRGRRRDDYHRPSPPGYSEPPSYAAGGGGGGRGGRRGYYGDQTNDNGGRHGRRADDGRRHMQDHGHPFGPPPPYDAADENGQSPYPLEPPPPYDGPLGYPLPVLVGPPPPYQETDPLEGTSGRQHHHGEWRGPEGPRHHQGHQEPTEDPRHNRRHRERQEDPRHNHGHGGYSDDPRGHHGHGGYPDDPRGHHGHRRHPDDSRHHHGHGEHPDDSRHHRRHREHPDDSRHHHRHGGYPEDPRHHHGPGRHGHGGRPHEPVYPFPRIRNPWTRRDLESVLRFCSRLSSPSPHRRRATYELWLGGFSGHIQIYEKKPSEPGWPTEENLKNIGSSIEQHLVDLVSGFGENPDAGFGERKFDLMTDIDGHVPGHLGVLITLERGDSSGRLD